MKTLSISFFCLLLAIISFAQAPQGLNYQAVVLGANNAPLSKHYVSLRLSILDSVANGPIVYQETQNPTTDSSGLFSVVIGYGTITAGNFLTINWGNGAKFLKTEIDTSGGSNYVLMGVTQFMSVPYALYANQTKATYVSMENPDGLINLTAVLIGTTPYTVPIGKNLYIPVDLGIAIGSDTLDPTGIESGSIKNVPIGASEGQLVHSTGDSIPGWLVDKTVDWITTDIISNPITVPIGKIFIITFTEGNFQYNNALLDGAYISPYLSGVIIGPGQTLSASGSYQFIINGYFRNQ